jgi:hypothetical protein
MVSTRKPRNVLPEKKSVANKLAYAVLLMVATVLIYQKLIIGPTIVFKSLYLILFRPSPSSGLQIYFVSNL